MEAANKNSSWSRLGRRRLRKDAEHIAKLRKPPTQVFDLGNLELKATQEDCSFLQSLPWNVWLAIYELLILTLSKVLHIDDQRPFASIPAKRQQRRICSSCSCDLYLPQSKSFSSIKHPANCFGGCRRSHYCPQSARLNGEISSGLKWYFALGSSCRRMWVNLFLFSFITKANWFQIQRSNACSLF